MGRKIKRVAMDFKWPMSKVWRGFINPYAYEQCPWCDGGGLSREAKAVSDDWYDFARTGRRWCDAITDDEVAALVEASRLRDFTHTWSPESRRWERRPDGYIPSADEVNEWQRARGMGHDSINAWICLEARCKRLGIAHKCPECDGSGELWSSPEAKARYEEWTPTEPPAGEGWQVWETVSDGSPITPVFGTPEALAHFLSADGDDWSRNGKRALPQYDDALAFVTAGWAPSAMVSGGVMRDAYGTPSAQQRSGAEGGE